MQAKPIFDLYARFLRMAWHGKAKSSIHAKEKAWLTNQRYAFYMPNPLGVRQVSSMAMSKQAQIQQQQKIFIICFVLI